MIILETPKKQIKMKKGLLLLFVAGAMLVSCSGEGKEKEAASAFCDCYSDLAEASSAAASAESATDMLGSLGEMQEMALKAQACQKELDAKYEGQLDLDIFKEEVKKGNEAVYNMAVEQGAF